MTTVYVTNKWEKTLVDEYAYKPYTFPVNESVEVPIEIARHIFGYGSENKEPFWLDSVLLKQRMTFLAGWKFLQNLALPNLCQYRIAPYPRRLTKYPHLSHYGGWGEKSNKPLNYGN